MPDQESHIQIANNNQVTLNYLLQDPDNHSPWIAVVGFYKALHIVEAIFFSDPEIGHTHTHGDRDFKLKTTSKYINLYRDYSRLSRAASIARYIERDSQEYPLFRNYMPPNVVVATLIGVHLYNVESFARTRLQPGTALTCCRGSVAAA